MWPCWWSEPHRRARDADMAHLATADCGRWGAAFGAAQMRPECSGQPPGPGAGAALRVHTQWWTALRPRPRPTFTQRAELELGPLAPQPSQRRPSAGSRSVIWTGTVARSTAFAPYAARRIHRACAPYPPGFFAIDLRSCNFNKTTVATSPVVRHTPCNFPL